MALAQRMEELHGLYVRLHLSPSFKGNSYVDGVCQGVADNCAILDPDTTGARTLVPLEQIAAVTQLPPPAAEGG